MRTIHWLALLPFLFLLGGPILHDATHPFLLGMPFLLGWIALGLPFTALVMALIYRLDPANRPGDREEGR